MSKAYPREGLRQDWREVGYLLDILVLVFQKKNPSLINQKFKNSFDLIHKA